MQLIWVEEDDVISTSIFKIIKIDVLLIFKCWGYFFTQKPWMIKIFSLTINNLKEFDICKKICFDSIKPWFPLQRFFARNEYFV